MSISPLDKEAGEFQNGPFLTRNQLTAGVCAKSATCWLYAFPTRKKAACYFTCFTPCQCMGANQFLLAKHTAFK